MNIKNEKELNMLYLYLIVYLIAAAFVYGFVRHDPNPNASISDEALGIALGWPVILLGMIISVLFVIAFGIILLILSPFYFLGYLTYVLMNASYKSIKMKKLQIING